MDWTREDIEAFFADSANEAGFEDAWKFLSQTGNDHLQGATISDADALSVLQGQFDSLISSGSLLGQAFPCEGIDFTGRSLVNVDLSNCSGLTGEQLMSASELSWITIPALDFTGVDFTGKRLISVTGFHLATGLTGEQLASVSGLVLLTLPPVNFSGVDLSGRTFSNIDFSRCTGLTAQQVLSCPDITYAIFPNMDFTGADMTGKDLAGIDFTKCSGLTGAQLSKASPLANIRLTSDQYSTMKEDLPSGISVYVDDILTKIP